jgi:hypothetical protein
MVSKTAVYSLRTDKTAKKNKTEKFPGSGRALRGNDNEKTSSGEG